MVLTELFISAFITLFVVIDPPGCAPIYAGLTKGASPAQARSMALRATAIASVILLIFALFGQELLGALHIELDSFRIAGGLMLFWIAFEMVFEKRTQRRTERAEKIAATPEVEDVSVFPMAMPMLAGPGAIATVMLLMGPGAPTLEKAATITAMVLVLIIAVFMMAFASRIGDALGRTGMNAITRILGMLLMALSTQYVFDGVRVGILEQISQV